MMGEAYPHHRDGPDNTLRHLRQREIRVRDHSVPCAGKGGSSGGSCRLSSEPLIGNRLGERQAVCETWYDPGGEGSPR